MPWWAARDGRRHRELFLAQDAGDSKPRPSAERKRVWAAPKLPPDAVKNYGFGAFQVEMNELTPDLKPGVCLPPPRQTRTALVRVPRVTARKMLRL